METLQLMIEELNKKGAYYIDPENKIVLSREHVGETIAGNYEASLLALQDGSLLSCFEKIDKEAYEYLTELQNKELALPLIIFYLQYFLNNKLPFSYKEYAFKDLKSIGRLLFDNKIEETFLLEILDNKLFSYYLKVLEIDKVDEHLYNNVVLAENLTNYSNVHRFHLVAYALTQKDNYEYAGRKFFELEDFYNYLLSHKKMVRFSETFANDENFIPWLLNLGKLEIVDKWKQLVETYSTHDDVTIKKGKVVNKKGKK